MAKIITKSIQSANSQLNKLVTSYNEQSWYRPPQSVSMAEVRNPNLPVWVNVHGPHQDVVPHAMPVKLVELTAKQLRCVEGEDIVLQEMTNVLGYYEE